jgi:hypothetical protein
VREQNDVEWEVRKSHGGRMVARTASSRKGAMRRRGTPA